MLPPKSRLIAPLCMSEQSTVGVLVVCVASAIQVQCNLKDLVDHHYVKLPRDDIIGPTVSYA